ncbi:MAG: ABC transporter substrate-binding protein [Nitriliruptor sp.]
MRAARTRRHGTRRAVAATAALALFATACGGDDGGEGGDGGDGGEASGEVSLLHGITGEAEQAALQAAVDAFEEESGNTVNVEASPDFDTTIVTRTTGGNAPDVALYPQPGVLERLASQDAVVPLEEAGVDMAGLEGELIEGMVETGTFDDEAYGVVVKLNLKSLLWYSPTGLDEVGADGAPETWDDLMSVSEDFASEHSGDGSRAPWCIGMESGGDTGWVATDWIEDIMLRLHGPDVYDQWVEHEIEFDSPEVREAFEMLEEIWFDEDQVVGGTTAILQTPFLQGNAPMFNDPPGCLFHRQAGFIAGEFPDDAELGTDFDMAYFPPIDESVGNPVLFAGDLAAIHTDNPVAAEFVEFLVSEAGQTAWMENEGAGALAVRTEFDTGVYPTDELARQGEILSGADFARFDASDVMPGEIGTGAFWTEIVTWLNGNQDLDATLQNIDAAWPSES